MPISNFSPIRVLSPSKPYQSVVVRSDEERPKSPEPEHVIILTTMLLSDECRAVVPQVKPVTWLSVKDRFGRPPPAYTWLPDVVQLALLEVRIRFSSNQITRNTHE